MAKLAMSNFVVEVSGKKYPITGETVLRKEVGGEFFYLGEDTQFATSELPKEWKVGDSIAIFPSPGHYYGWFGKIVRIDNNVFTLDLDWFGS